MSTLMQRNNIINARKHDNRRSALLKKCPHAKGWVNRATIVTPRKPNSAKRPVAKIFLRKHGRMTAHLPGVGHTIRKYSKILAMGCGPHDLPGVRYTCVRGVLDFIGLVKKKRRRSIYGAEQNNLRKIRVKKKYRLSMRKSERENAGKEAFENFTVMYEEKKKNRVQILKKIEFSKEEELLIDNYIATVLPVIKSINTKEISSRKNIFILSSSFVLLFFIKVYLYNYTDLLIDFNYNNTLLFYNFIKFFFFKKNVILYRSRLIFTYSFNLIFSIQNYNLFLYYNDTLFSFKEDTIFFFINLNKKVHFLKKAKKKKYFKKALRLFISNKKLTKKINLFNKTFNEAMHLFTIKKKNIDTTKKKIHYKLKKRYSHDLLKQKNPLKFFCNFKKQRFFFQKLCTTNNYSFKINCYHNFRFVRFAANFFFLKFKSLRKKKKINRLTHI